MTRLEYWLRAQTQYNVHSPFVYDLYRHVLFARVEGGICRNVPRERRRFEQICYKLEHYFEVERCEKGDGHAMYLCADVGAIEVVCRPHADREAEQNWEQRCNDGAYRVSIDLYDVGLLFSNPRLHRQRFILR